MGRGARDGDGGWADEVRGILSGLPGQDYANYRYYSQVTGSFWSPDPAGAGAADAGYGSGMAASYTPGFGAAHPDTPLSWNRYLYSLGDPINLFDPIGKYACDPDVDDSCDDDPDCGDALSPCPTDSDQGGDNGQCATNDDGTFTCPVTAPTTSIVVTAPTLEPIAPIVEPSPGVFASVLGAIVDFFGSFSTALGGVVAFPTTMGCRETLSIALEDRGSAPRPRYPNEERCELQFESDLNVCRVLRSSSCYDQAYQRYAACLAGKPIPPFPHHMPATPGNPTPPPKRKKRH